MTKSKSVLKLSQNCGKIFAGFKIVTKKIKMKRGSNPRVLLGLTQEQMAMLLNISRSHWTMYELGKRDLPTSALLLLADIMAHAETVAGKTAPKTEHVIKQEETLVEALTKLLKENQYQQEHLARKLAALEQKHEAQLKTQLLADYLKAKKPNHKGLELGLLNMINAKATNGVTPKDLLQMTRWQIKLILLQEEKKLLEEHIAKKKK